MNKTLKVATRDSKLKQLSGSINEKARELQNITEAVDNAKKANLSEVERKARLLKECADLENKIKELTNNYHFKAEQVKKAEVDKELHAQRVKELEVEKQKYSEDCSLIGKQLAGNLEAAKKIENDIVSKKESVEGLRNLIVELEKNKELNNKQIEDKLKILKDKENELKLMAEQQQQTYIRMVKFAGMIEHNLKRLNYRYAMGGITIKIPMPEYEMVEFQPFIIK